MTSSVALHVIVVTATSLLLFSSAYTLADDNFISHERRLYNDLLKNYEKAVRPVNKTSDTLIVKIELTLVTVDFVDEETQMLSTSVWFKSRWNDFQLAWNKTQYDNIDLIRIPTSLLWTPDLTLYNGAGDHLITITNHLAMVSSNGDVFIVVPLSLQTRCTTDARYFPYDKQTCHIKIGSWTYDGQQIDLQFFDELKGNSSEVDLHHFTGSGQFDVVDVSARINKVIYPCCPEFYPDITYDLNLKRRSNFATHLFLAPSVTLSLIIPTIFILPADSTERTTLGIGVLIANTLLLGELIRYVPAGHHAVMPIMSQFFLANIVLVALSLVVSTAVINLSSRDAKDSTGPGAVVQLIFLNTFMTKVLCIQSSNSDTDNTNNKNFSSGVEEVVTSDSIQLNDDRIQIIREQERNRMPGDWRTVAAVLDRLFLIVFFVVVAVLSLSFLQFL